MRSFPAAVRAEIGPALYAAQKGETDPAAKPLKGFGGRELDLVWQRLAEAARDYRERQN